MKPEEICYIDNHGDICLNQKKKVRICCGSQHIITIDKLFGPICVSNLKIVWEGNDWNVRNIIKRLRTENRELKQQCKIISSKKLKYEKRNMS